MGTVRLESYSWNPSQSVLTAGSNSQLSLFQNSEKTWLENKQVILIDISRSGWPGCPAWKKSVLTQTPIPILNSVKKLPYFRSRKTSVPLWEANPFVCFYTSYLMFTLFLLLPGSSVLNLKWNRETALFWHVRSSLALPASMAHSSVHF